MDTIPSIPAEPPVRGILWDNRFSWSRMALGVAAGCWILACPLFAAAPGALAPLALVPAVPVVAGIALAVGRFDPLAKIAAAAAFALGALGWWIAWDHGQGNGDMMLALLSALPPGWLTWYVFWSARANDLTGVWGNPHSVSAAMACCAVVACGLWGVALWAMREFAHVGHPGIQTPLLWVWMVSSLWCVNTVVPALKAAQEVRRLAAPLRARLHDHESVVLFGVFLLPWGLGAGTMFIEAASRGPFDHILHPGRTTPLWLAVVPLVIGVSALNAARTLHALLTTPRDAVMVAPDDGREATP